MINNSKTKNLNRTSGHRISMFKNLVESFNKNGYIVTTLAKGKMLRNLIATNETKIFMAKLDNRKGDNAQMVKLVSENFLLRKYAKTN